MEAIITLTAFLGRTPTEEELNRYEAIFKEFDTESKKQHDDYINTLFEGKSKDGSVTVKVDYRFSAKEISADETMEQKVLLLKVQEAFNNALDVSTESYKAYITKSQLLSGRFSDRIAKEFAPIKNNIPELSKTLN